LDEVVACLNATDPRIWPMKIAWLVGSYKSPVAALTACQAYLERAWVGFSPTRDNARAWATLDAELGLEIDDRALLRWIETRWTDEERTPGFSVPLRPKDERVEWLKAS